TTPPMTGMRPTAPAIAPSMMAAMARLPRSGLAAVSVAGCARGSAGSLSGSTDGGVGADRLGSGGTPGARGARGTGSGFAGAWGWRSLIDLLLVRCTLREHLPVAGTNSVGQTSGSALRRVRPLVFHRARRRP